MVKAGRLANGADLRMMCYRRFFWNSFVVRNLSLGVRGPFVEFTSERVSNWSLWCGVWSGSLSPRRQAYMTLAWCSSVWFSG